MKTDDHVHLVIMAGGSGTRFWPKSTPEKPKQLLRFGNSTDSLIVQTLKRFDSLVKKDPKHRWIVTTESLSPAIKSEVGASSATVLGEPAARNTAPCVYWAARTLFEADPNAIMLVMPSDHHIPREKDFLSTLTQAINWAHTHDDLVTLGVKPTRPETGYGYLHIGKSLGSGCNQVSSFVEKPDTARAEQFIRSGDYLWNGGMFVWRAKTILDAFDLYMPEMKKAWNDSHGNVSQAYPKMTATSIDFGVMEKSQNVVTFTLDCGWDDLGSWTSLENESSGIATKKESGFVAGGTVVSIDSTGNVVDTEGKRVALLGVNDLIIVQSGDSILVAHKSRAQEIKKIQELALKK